MKLPINIQEKILSDLNSTGRSIVTGFGVFHVKRYKAKSLRQIISKNKGKLEMKNKDNVDIIKIYFKSAKPFKQQIK